MMTKTSLMLGLGETKEEVLDTLLEAREAEVDLVTLGQYLRPRGCDLAVKRYVAPEEFQELRQKAMSMGFRQVMAGPLVRSSYHAQELIRRSEEMTC
jgi:lipoic acid synthetase